MANMLQLIFKNLTTKQSTRLYPIEKERESFERSRGRIIMDPNTCILCGICARKCPADAITVQRGTGKWELDAYRCIICGECASACPKKSITLTNERRHSSEGKLFEGHHVEPPKPVSKPLSARPATVQAPTVTTPVSKSVVVPVVTPVVVPVAPVVIPLDIPVTTPVAIPIVTPLTSPIIVPVVSPIATPEATPDADPEVTVAPSPEIIPGHETTPEGSSK